MDPAGRSSLGESKSLIGKRPEEEGSGGYAESSSSRGRLVMVHDGVSGKRGLKRARARRGRAESSSSGQRCQLANYRVL